MRGTPPKGFPALPLRGPNRKPVLHSPTLMRGLLEIAMNPRVKAIWLAALRGGAYLQGKSRLCRKDLLTNKKVHCCLGVLCEEAIKDGVPLKRTHRTYNDIEVHVFNGASTILPSAVAKWAGLEPGVTNPTLGGATCMGMNDMQGANFSQIADAIEKHL